MCTAVIAAAAYSAAGYGAASYAGLSTAATYAATAYAGLKGVQAAGDIQAAEYNKTVAEQNAKTLEQQANIERQTGAVEAGRKTMETRQKTARALTEFAGQGVDISTGTSADLLEQSTEMGQLDSLTIINNANRKALGYEAQAQNLVNQADLQKRSARNRFGTSLLTTAGQIGMLGA